MKTRNIAFFKSIGGKIMLITTLVVVISIGLVTVLTVMQSSNALMTEAFDQLESVRDAKMNQLQSWVQSQQNEMDFIVENTGLLQEQAMAEVHAAHASRKAEIERYFRDNTVTGDMLVPGGEVHQRMNEIVGSRVAMGTTGETYLLSAEDGRYFFRSDMQTMGGGEFVFGADKTEMASGLSYVRQAVAGNGGAEVYTDSSGQLVLVEYSPLDIPGRNWIMVTKKSFEESVAVTLEGDEQDVFHDFIEKFGYYDLFLVHPGTGEVFYTVAHEADYGTDILNGEYSDSGLADAVRKAIETRSFSFADFSPYEPSGGEPASFIAEPIVRNGKVQLVIALQVSIDEINGFMSDRSGMGETGESYLVGPDKLMRSDSYLDPENHTVKASFARPAAGDVDTVAVANALSGKTGAKVITDYTGSQVLSAYAPADIYGTTWVLLSEINEGEVRAPVNSLVVFIVISAVVMVAVAIVAAVLFSRTISKPLGQGVGFAKQIADGDLDVELEVNRADEIGELADAMRNMQQSLKYKADILERIAEGDLTNDVELSSERDTLGKSLISMSKNLNEVLGQVREAVEQVSSGSNQVSQSSQSLSQGATEQASSLEEISSSLNEIASQSKQNADNSNEANSLARSATENAEAGNSQMKELVEAMENITASSEEISKVVKVIDDIAFQINLLALNANVEAARAGKYGKGFAVVAEEVRNLAVRSAESVKETTQMVEDSNRSTELGSEIAGKVAAQLDDIVTGISKVADVLGEISVASKEQAQGVEQINEGLEQIDQVTQGNTASAEESASASEELSAQAQQLNGMVARFKLQNGHNGGRREKSAKSATKSGSNGGGAQSGQSAQIAHGAHQTGGNGGAHKQAPVQTAKKTATGNGEEHAENSGGNGNESGHESAGKGGEAQDARRPVNPKEVIKLDDDDFGRF